jgi:phytoene dehydrogenase-like protein
VTNTAVIIIGAGRGGLTAAIRLSQSGFRVRVIEARAEAGGLASGCVFDGFSFDARTFCWIDLASSGPSPPLDFHFATFLSCTQSITYIAWTPRSIRP